MTPTPREHWIWMPHPAHLIVGSDCRFHLATVVGPYDHPAGGPWIVSTVGEYLPDEGVREIHASVRKIQLEGRGDARCADFLRKCGWMEIGVGRTYETMVFRARMGDGKCGCPFVTLDGYNLDFRGYTDAGAAYVGHLELCEKWAAMDPADVPPE